MAVIDSAIALYRAGNYSGSGDWLDESGNGYDLTLTDCVFTAQSSPALAYFTLNGSSSFMTYNPPGTQLDPLLGSWTVLIVVRNSNYATNRFPPVDTRDSFSAGGSGGFTLYGTTNGAPRGEFADGSTEANDVAGNPTNNQIHEMATRLDRSVEEVETFLDGTGSGSPASSAGVGSIGSSGTFDVGRVATTYYGGDVFGLAVWDSPLSDADVATAGDELRVPISTGNSLLLLGVG